MHIFKRVLLVTVSTLISYAVADVSFTSPPAGSSVPVGTLSVAWTDTATAPAISTLTSYELFLCAGGNDAASIVVLATITTKGLFIDGNSAIGAITAGLGASTPKNAYFLKIISVIGTGGTVTNYSPRFSLTGMTGSFPPAVLAGLTKLGSSSTTGPTRELGAAAPNVPAAGDEAFKVPFAMQTGPIIYAPMMQLAPTKITRQKQTPQNPTSPVPIATTYLPPNNAIQKTVTQERTWSFSQRENPASPAAGPASDMQRFLERWKD